MTTTDKARWEEILWGIPVGRGVQPAPCGTARGYGDPPPNPDLGAGGRGRVGNAVWLARAQTHQGFESDFSPAFGVGAAKSCQAVAQ